MITQRYFGFFDKFDIWHAWKMLFALFQIDYQITKFFMKISIIYNYKGLFQAIHIYNRLNHVTSRSKLRFFVGKGIEIQ